MPLQNRVTPFGEIVAHPARGRMMGNRGCLHDAHRQLGRARWRHKTWISCVLSFKGRRREVMAPSRYTELFFTDEAVALAAGHRPCAECRRADYLAFRAAFAAAHPALGPAPKAAEIDAVLHDARTGDGAVWRTDVAALPDGTFVRDAAGAACLLWRGRAWRWSFAEYRACDATLGGEVSVLTPQPLVAALAAGYHMSNCFAPGIPTAEGSAVRST